MEPSPPVEIVRKHDQALVGYACSTCGVFFTIRKMSVIAGRELTEEEAKQEATQHCVKFCICGQPLEKYYKLLCSACQGAREAEREKARFEKAEKISIEDYDGPIVWDDEYYDSVDALLDHCESEGLDVPEYVWSTSPQVFSLSAENVIERELELQEMHEDAYDYVGTKAKDNLQAYLDVWCKELNLVSYFANTSRAVLLRPDAQAAAG